MDANDARDEYAEARADRLEDLAFMADHGETLDRAARRIGLSEKSLQKYLMRWDKELYGRFPKIAPLVDQKDWSAA